MGNTSTSSHGFGERFSAVHQYVKATQDLPPTYHTCSTFKNGIVPDLVTDKSLDDSFKAYDAARQNVIDKCGFDPVVKKK